MKKQLLSLTIIAGMVASASAATILTDFSTTAGTHTNVAITNGSVAVTGGSELVYKDGSLAATTNIRGVVNTSEALAMVIAPAQNNSTPQATFAGGILALTYTVGAANVEISAITLKSGFFDGGLGTFKNGAAKADYTLTFKNVLTGETLSTWTGTQSYIANATATNATILSGAAFTVTAGSDLKLEIQAAKPVTGSSNTGGFFGVDSVSMEATAVPEPATAGLGLLGLGALMLRRRRK